MINLIGQSLGRYRILEQLGEGGMATIYKAYDTRLERDVAIKVIRRGAFPAEQLERLLKRFDREAKALAKLSHANIVGVIDYGDYDGAPYLVMEYLPGGTLKQLLGKPIPWRDAARTLLPVARALDYAHRQGMVHRDVKPANILITADGDPMLTDFGIAKILETEETTALTGTGMGVGTPEYMAPEQWTGEAIPQSDIYSLGVIFYEMVTGRKPYTADTPAAILLKQATEPLPRPTRYVQGLPEGVEKVLIKALARDPRDRYLAMSAFAEALEGLLVGENKPRLATTPAPGKQAEKSSVPDSRETVLQDESQDTRDQGPTRDDFDQRKTVTPAAFPSKSPAATVTGNGKQSPPAGKHQRPWILGIGGVVVGLCLVALVVFGLIFLPKTGKLPTTSPYTVSSPTVPVEAALSSPTIPTEIILPSPTIPAEVILPSPTSLPPIGGGSGYIYFIQGGTIYRVTARGTDLEKLGATSASKIAWKDRNTFYYANGDLNLAVIDGSTITSTRLANYAKAVSYSTATDQLAAMDGYYLRLSTGIDPGNQKLYDNLFQADCVSFSPDGKDLAMYVTGEIQGSIFTAGTSLRIQHMLDGYIDTFLYAIGSSCIDWSPDGKRIAYAKQSNGAGIYMMNSENANDNVLLTGTTGADPAWSPDGQWLAFDTRDGLSIIRADGTGEIQILGMGYIKYPVWQP